MNLALASIVLASPGGFIRDTELSAIIEADRLCWLLVRCGGCRFSCPAQDISRLLWCIGKGGDYVRDISFPAQLIAEANAFMLEHRALAETPPCQPSKEVPVSSFKLPSGKLKTAAALRAQDYQEGCDWICTGNFDGTICGSDAEGNL